MPSFPRAQNKKEVKEVHQDELEYDSSRAEISQSEVRLGSSVPEVLQS